jgi:hypothetical protein
MLPINHEYADSKMSAKFMLLDFLISRINKATGAEVMNSMAATG